MTQETIARHILDSSIERMQGIKALGEKAIAQLNDSHLHWTPDPETNTVAILVKHLHGNMLSRWTDFLTTDGEKPWRNRDGEFEMKVALPKETILQLWEDGWAAVFDALNALQADDVMKTVTIRGKDHSVIDAIHRQIAHYSYHTGQIVQLAKQRLGSDWKTLSIARGQSKAYRPEGKE